MILVRRALDYSSQEQTRFWILLGLLKDFNESPTCLFIQGAQMWHTLFSFIFAGLKFRENFLGTFRESKFAVVIFRGSLSSRILKNKVFLVRI